jgi:hypothetical protein
LRLSLQLGWCLAAGSQHVFHAGAPEGMDRLTLRAETLLWTYLLYPIQRLLLLLFLWPDMPDNADLITMEHQLVPGWYWSTDWTPEGCFQVTPMLVLLLFRTQIFNALKAPFLTKQRLEDGAFIATLLAEDDPDDMIDQATALFRGIPFSNVSADLLRSSKGSAEEYELSSPCKLNTVDFFVSHSTSF